MFRQALLTALLVSIAALNGAAVKTAKPTAADMKPVQILRLADEGHTFALLVSASADLYNLPTDIRQVVVQLQSTTAHPPEHDLHQVLLLTVHVLDADDQRLQPDMPGWHADGWSRGEASTAGYHGITALSVLRGLINHLERRRHFPALREIILLGDGIGAKLQHLHVQRPDLSLKAWQ